MNQQAPLYPTCIFVCTNNRGTADGVRISCGVQGSEELRIRLKAACKEHGVAEQVRVHSSGCMEGCEIGPNVLVFPAGTMYTGVQLSDCDTIIERHIAPKR